MYIEYKSKNVSIDQENQSLKSALESIKDKFKSKENEFRIQFQELQSNTQSIHEHHKELEYILKEYDGQFQGILALESTLVSLSNRDFNREKKYGDSDSIHPYPFQILYSQLQKYYTDSIHANDTLELKRQELRNRLSTLEQEITTQSLLLSSQSHEKNALQEQLKRLGHSLELKTKDLSDVVSSNEKLKLKLKKILIASSTYQESL